MLPECSLYMAVLGALVSPEDSASPTTCSGGGFSHTHCSTGLAWRQCGSPHFSHTIFRLLSSLTYLRFKTISVTNLGALNIHIDNLSNILVSVLCTSTDAVL